MRVTPWLYSVGSRQFGLSSRYDCPIYALRSAAGILLIDSGSGLGHAAVMANPRAEFGDDLSRGTILLTHRHPDHVRGAPRLAEELGWPVAASEHTAHILITGDETGRGLTDAQSKGAYPSEMRLDGGANVR